MRRASPRVCSTLPMRSWTRLRPSCVREMWLPSCPTADLPESTRSCPQDSRPSTRSRHQRDPTAPCIAHGGVAGLRILVSGSVHVWAVTPVSCTSPASAQPEPTEYFVSLADPADHLAHVSIRLRNGRRNAHSCHAGLECAVPGSQLCRERGGCPRAGWFRRRGRGPQHHDQRVENHAPPGCVVVSYDIHLDVPGPFGSSAKRRTAASSIGPWC